MTIITPTLPPHPGGVADYAALLARHWPEPDAATRWIVAEGGAESRAAFPDWSIVSVDELRGGWPEALAGVGDDILLVNYAQYGFSLAGMPFDLVNALRAWRAEAGGPKAETGKLKAEGHSSGTSESDEHRGDGETEAGTTEMGKTQLSAFPFQLSADAVSSRRLAVFFHETWLTGPWWRRRGLVAPLAARLARRLAAAADVVVTNCRRHAAQLQPVTPRAIEVLSVPSNIQFLNTPEQPRAAVWPERLRVVVFGLSETRLRALRAHAGLLDWLIAEGRLAELVLLGGGSAPDRFSRAEARWLHDRAPGAAVRRAANLPPAEIAAELAAADLALSGYAEDEVGKSGTVAACRMAGCAIGFAGHDGGGLGWNLACDGHGPAAPHDWARLSRATRSTAPGDASSSAAGDWPLHATRLHGLLLKC